MKTFVFLLTMALTACGIEDRTCPAPDSDPIVIEPTPVTCEPETACVQLGPYLWDCSGTPVCAAYPGISSITMTVTCSF